MSHTKGWRIDEGRDQFTGGFRIYEGDEYLGCFLEEVPARTAATAPELLEACREALKALCSGDDVIIYDAECVLTEAIAKAEGRP